MSSSLHTTNDNLQDKVYTVSNIANKNEPSSGKMGLNA